MRNRVRPPAFTLVELLVVIGIIAVLISILLPALSRARQQAVSAQCMSNMKQVGMAALMYANDNKGWFPPSQAADNGGNQSDEKFLDWGAGANRYSVREAMARYAGYKVPYFDAVNGTPGYVSPNTPLFNCPADDQPVGNIVWPDNNLLNHDPALVGGNALSTGKIRYWWVANPWYPSSVTPRNGDPDAQAANNGSKNLFAHMDVTPDQNDPTKPPNSPWFNTNNCIPGRDYLRTTKDKHQADVAIMVCRSKQQATTPYYMMHGPSGPGNKKGWRNELFGDGHCEARVWSQLKQHWSGDNPQSW